MDIFLIRHTPVVVKGLCYGQTDVPLADDFLTQAQHLQSLLPNKFDSVYTSPSSRCKALADFLSHHLDNKPIQDPRLQELYFGTWEQQTWDAIFNNDNARYETWAKDFVNQAPPNGETLQQMVNRIQDFLNDLLPKTEKNTVLLITHAGVIRCLYALNKQLPLSDLFQLKVNFGSLYYFNTEKPNSFIEKYRGR